jgi:hypothetical protein
MSNMLNSRNVNNMKIHRAVPRVTLCARTTHTHTHTHTHRHSTWRLQYYIRSIFGTLLQMNMCIILHKSPNLFFYTFVVLYCGCAWNLFPFMKSAAHGRKMCFYFLAPGIRER